MAIELEVLLALQVTAMPDTVVSLVIPPEPTVFDYAHGTLQILVLIVGFVALGAMAFLALTLRKSIIALQGTVERLTADAKPLLHQATRLSEDAHDIVKTVRREVDKLADAAGQVSERIHDLSDTAAVRIDQANALLDVLQGEVQDTALDAVAAARGLKVGAAALGAALAGNSSRSIARKKSRQQTPRIRARDEAETPLFDMGSDVDAGFEALAHDIVDEGDDRVDDDIDDYPDERIGDDDHDEQSRPYFDDVDDARDDDRDDASNTSDERSARRRPR